MLRYGGPFLFLIALPILYSWHPLDVLLIIPVIVGALLVRGGEVASRPEVATAPGDHRAIPRVFVFGVLALLLWGLHRSIVPSLPIGDFLALAIALGVICGIFGLVAAHEMIHSRSRVDQFCGQSLLALLSYRHFHIAHLYGHHRFAATPLDPSTARRGESSYRFVVRTILQQWIFAWRFERRRLAGKAWHWPANRCCQDLATMVALYLSLFVLLGWRAVLLMALVSAIAIFLLEMFNYVAHYGMERRRDGVRGREPLGPAHSWNTSGIVANSLLFNMGRHSDHHRRAQTPYHRLQAEPGGPVLPGGYAGGILMALIPPLWWRYMDPRLAAHDELLTAVS